MPELPTDDVSEWTNAIGPNGIPRINITVPVSASPSLPVENQTNYIVEPDLIEAQQGKVALPPDVALNDAGIPFNKTTGKEIPVVRRPNVLPVAKTPDGYTFAWPKMADIMGSVMSPLAAPAVATKAGEVVLGSGAVRTMPEAAKAAEPAGPFFSTLAQAVDNARLTKGDASQWLGYLKNQPGVKAEEIGQVLGDLPSGQITKDQLQGIVQNNAVKLNEVVKGGEQPTKFTVSTAGGPIDQYSPPMRFDTLNQAQLELERRQVIAPNAYHNIAELPAEGSNTKYHSYQLHGGENYQEMLLTLPSKKLPMTDAQIRQHAKDIAEASGYNWGNLGPNTRQNYETDARRILEKDSGNYKSSHWDEPNIVAHVRYNDRNVEGAKTLHLEEVQSDWHQAGRKQGYIQKDLTALKSNADIVDQKLMDAKAEDIMANPDLNAGLKDAVSRKIISQKEADDYLRLTQNEHSKIPDAPFKKNWDELALKRMLHKAATEGYDALSWTPGEAQAARYDLSKQIDNIEYGGSAKAGDNWLTARDKNDNIVMQKRVDEKDLADHIGKEATDKLLKQQPKNGFRNLENADLKIGGEGMKSFYDKMLVDKANALAKKYGAKVESKEAPGKFQAVAPKGGIVAEFNNKTDAENWIKKMGSKYKLKQNSQPIHFLRLTPELRQKAVQGFPLFSTTPILNPVEFNPWKDQNKKYKLTPISGDPFND